MSRLKHLFFDQASCNPAFPASLKIRCEGGSSMKKQSKQARQTMKAVAIDEFGGQDKMKPRNVPVPEVGPDELLIRVETAGVGVWDPYEREGGFAKEYGITPSFPYVLGSDGAGTV